MKIDQQAVRQLLDRARREVDSGLLPSAQIALARDGELIASETYGDATDDTRYVVYSATKAFVAGAMWALIGDGAIDVSRRVVDYIPEFGTNGKDVITVEQVMLHTSGFPSAPLSALAGRHERRPHRGVRRRGGSTGTRARPTSTTRRPRTGCSPRSSSGSAAPTSARSCRSG